MQNLVAIRPGVPEILKFQFPIGFYEELGTSVFLKELCHLTRGQHRVLHEDSPMEGLSA